MKRLLFSLWCLLLAACGVSPGEQQTLEAYEMSLSTQLANLQGTALVDEAQLAQTVEWSGTRLARVSTEQALMQATLEATGIILNAPLSIVTDLPQNNSVVTPIAPSTSNVQVTPGNNPTPEADPSPLSNIVIAADVGADDCAEGITNQFNTNTNRIYIVATARDLPGGTTVVARWLRGTEPVTSFSHTFDQIDEACIWFFADQSDFAFTPGNYSVVMEIDNAPVTQPVSFSIVE